MTLGDDIADDRTNRAVTMRVQGHTLQEIADALGYANSGGAHKAVQRGLKQRAKEQAGDRDELIARDLELIDTIIKGMIPAILKGTPRSAEVALKAIERRAALLGTNAPVKVDAKITDALAAEIEDLVEQMANLDAQQAQQLLARERG